MNRKISIYLGLSICVVSVVSLFIGVIDIQLSDVLMGDLEKIEMIMISRFPRLLAILLTGAGMSVAGLIMQQLCSNKFVSPSTTSTLTSAQLGILVAMIVFPQASLATRTLISFAFAIGGTMIFVWFMQKIQLKDIYLVPLIGIMFSSVLSGVIDFLSYRFGLVQAMNSWLVGDFSLITKGRYEIAFLVVPLIVLAFVFANHFNIVGMGKNNSVNLGINYNLILYLGLGIAALISASIVVTVGTIPYLGLIIPNLVAMFRGDKIQNSLLDIALFGALFVLVCDIVGRLVIYPYEIPIQLTVGIVGSIVFLWTMKNQFTTSKVKKEKKRYVSSIQ